MLAFFCLEQHNVSAAFIWDKNQVWNRGRVDAIVWCECQRMFVFGTLVGNPWRPDSECFKTGLPTFQTWRAFGYCHCLCESHLVTSCCTHQHDSIRRYFEFLETGGTSHRCHWLFQFGFEERTQSSDVTSTWDDVLYIVRLRHPNMARRGSRVTILGSICVEHSRPKIDCKTWVFHLEWDALVRGITAEFHQESQQFLHEHRRVASSLSPGARALFRSRTLDSF